MKKDPHFEAQTQANSAAGGLLDAIDYVRRIDAGERVNGSRKQVRAAILESQLRFERSLRRALATLRRLGRAEIQKILKEKK